MRPRATATLWSLMTEGSAIVWMRPELGPPYRNATESPKLAASLGSIGLAFAAALGAAGGGAVFERITVFWSVSVAAPRVAVAVSTFVNG